MQFSNHKMGAARHRLKRPLIANWIYENEEYASS